MHRLLTLPIAAMLLVLSSATAFANSDSSPSRPNIIFLYADDLGYGDLSCYGSEHGRTPHLDRLAKEGTRFTQFYVSHCVCSPTRASAVTGHYPSRYRIFGHLASMSANKNRNMPDWLDVQAPSMPRALQRAGYRTAMIGKWHLGGGSGSMKNGKIYINHPDAPPVVEYGFDAARTEYGNSPTWREAKPWPEPHDRYPIEEPEWLTWSSQAIVDEAILFMESHVAEHSDKPFMMNVWFKDPHTPMTPPAEMRRQFKHLPEPVQTHYATVWQMDEQIGRLLQRLDELKLAENTLVIFSSDNGAGERRGGSNGPLRGHKWYLYEGGIRVPLIARWPNRVPADRVDETSALNICDFTPTFCRLAGAKMPRGYKSDGVDITKAFHGEPFRRTTPMFWHHPTAAARSPQLAVRQDDWVLLMNPNGTRVELYNLAEDIGQEKNVAEQNPRVVANLRNLLGRWYAALPVNAPGNLNSHRGSAAPPRFVAESPDNEADPVRFPDGTLRIYYVEPKERREIRSLGSTDHGLTWGDDREEFKLPGASYHAIQILRDDRGELHAMTIIRDEGPQGRRWDVWHNRTRDRGKSWEEPRRIYEGYVGSLRSFEQLPSGRLLLPVHVFVNYDPRDEAVSADGVNYGLADVTAFYSDDHGRTWQRSSSRLTVPQDARRATTNYGAVEPIITRMNDGALWMLIRTKNGSLWESFSNDDGATWSEASPSRFVSSDSPAATVRLSDGRLVLFTNACQRWDNLRDYAAGGRQVLQAAISRDDGKTWEGFREVLREPASGHNRGDRGTAYPSAVVTDEGNILLVSGQGFAKSILLIDPEWLEETAAQDDFSQGLEQWSHYGGTGVERIDHPEQTGARVLAIQKRDTRAEAGAIWNFPSSAKGELTLRIRLQKGFQGAAIALTDHFNPVSDTEAHKRAVAGFEISPSGEIHRGVALTIETWHDLRLAWDLPRRQVVIGIDGEPAGHITIDRPSEFGVNYLRLIVQGKPNTEGGLLMESAVYSARKDNLNRE